MTEQKQLDDDVYWMLTNGYTNERCKKCGVSIWLSNCESRFDESVEKIVITCKTEGVE